MKKHILIICLCILFVATAFAQEQKQMRWLLKANMGYSVPLIKFPSGHTTDNILGSVYSNNTYFQFPAITFFINKNWGIEASGAAYLSNPTDKYKDRVYSSISERYPDYYLSGYNDFNDSKIAMRMGPVYKWEQERFVFICGLPIISFMDVDTSSANFSLKRKDSNDMLNLSYSINNEYGNSQVMYNISPYFTVGYRLTSRIILNAEAGFNLYKAKFKYIETERNWITGNITTQHFLYNKWVSDLNIELGLQFVLKNKW